MNFNGYELFHHIKDAPLRTYNRVNTYLSILDRHGKEVGKSYLKKFDRKAQLSIFETMKKIDDVGFEQYRRDFTRTRNA